MNHAIKKVTMDFIVSTIKIQLIQLVQHTHYITLH